MATVEKRYSCRKCRSILFEEEHLISHGDNILDDVDTNGQSNPNKMSDQQQTSMFLLLDHGNLPEWVEHTVEEGYWTKGKLHCPKCESRLGAFNFVNLPQTPLSDATPTSSEVGGVVGPPSPVYIVKSKIDIITPHVVYEDSMELLSSADSSVGSCCECFDEMLDVTEIIEPLHGEEEGGPKDGKEHKETIDGKQNKTKGDEEQEDEEDKVAKEEEVPHVYRKSRQSVTVFENDSFDPSVLPAYPEVYGEDEFSSSLKSLLDDDVKTLESITNASSNSANTIDDNNHHNHDNSTKTDDLLFSSTTPLRNCCRRCQLLHEQLFSIAATSSNGNNNNARPTTKNRATNNTTRDRRHKKNENVTTTSLRHHKVTYQANGRAHSSSCFSFNNSGGRVVDRCTSCDDKGNHGDDDKLVEEKPSVPIEEEISDNHQCPVCLDIFYDVHRTRCMHDFCAPCIRQLYKTSGKKPLCPLCRCRIHQVDRCQEMDETIKNLYPIAYRKRKDLEKTRSINREPLPNRLNVQFGHDHEHARNNWNMRTAAQTGRYVLLIVLFVCSYLFHTVYRCLRGFARDISHILGAFFLMKVLSLVAPGYALTSLSVLALQLFVGYRVCKILVSRRIF